MQQENGEVEQFERDANFSSVNVLFTISLAVSKQTDKGIYIIDSYATKHLKKIYVNVNS